MLASQLGHDHGKVRRGGGTGCYVPVCYITPSCPHTHHILHRGEHAFEDMSESIPFEKREREKGRERIFHYAGYLQNFFSFYFFLSRVVSHLGEIAFRGKVLSEGHCV